MPKGLSGASARPDAPARPLPGFHGAVSDFKRRLLEATLTQAGGNRTRAARALGLQRTYLLRLIREFEIRVPPGSLPARRPEPDGPSAAAPTQTR
jgi:DNA-binding NtrC family response regulator